MRLQIDEWVFDQHGGLFSDQLKPQQRMAAPAVVFTNRTFN